MKIQKALHRIRTKSSLNNRYLYYWFYHAGKHGLLEPYFTGTTIKHLTGRALNNLEIPLPPLSHQEFMAEVLGSLDDKIQLNHQTNQTLEQMAQAIFKSWFVDFEPVKAKIAALEAGGSEEDALLAAMQAISGKDETELTRLQAEQPEQYAELRATAELFPSAMQDSELGEIPEGWYVTQIGDEVTVVGGGTPSTKNPDFWENGEINWTSPKDLSNLADKVLVETERKVTEAGLAKISSGLLPVDTVLMSSRAPVGYLALAKIPVAVNQGYIAMKCEKALSPEFVIQWCAAHMDEIKSRASGTTFAEISKKNFKIIPVVMPTESLISIYSKQASSLYEAIENNVRESDTLAKLRDSLLPKLLSGELSVSDVESHIADEAEPANV
jgi:type I restriction enzyme S subunit